MGYGISTNAVFGVFLSVDESKLVKQAIENYVKNLPKTQDVLDVLDDEYDGDAVSFFIDSEFSKTGPYISMISEGSDSRIDHTIYDEQFEHSFGVVLARKGYGSHMDSKTFNQKLAQGPSPSDIALFNKVCAPILAQAGITEAPSMVVASYTA